MIHHNFQKARYVDDDEHTENEISTLKEKLEPLLLTTG